MKTAAVILSGGMSRRMGSDKSLLLLDGRTFLQRAADIYAPYFERVYVSVNRAGRFPIPQGAAEVEDLYPGSGPLAGLHAALSAGPEAVFLAAVDLPFADGAAAAALMALLEGHDACVIRRGDKFEPAFAAYGRGCLPAAEELLRAGENKMGLLLRRVDTRWAGPEDLPGFDLERILSNVNRPEDLEKIKTPGL